MVRPRLFFLFWVTLIWVTPALVRAGDSTQTSADSKAVAEQAQQKNASESWLSRFHVTVDTGFESYFEFRGVNIIPDQTISGVRAYSLYLQSSAFTQSTGMPALDRPTAIATAKGLFQELGEPASDRVARGSGIYTVDVAISYTLDRAPQLQRQQYGTLTAGGFYAVQTTPRVNPQYSTGGPPFDEYQEVDLFARYDNNFGPFIPGTDGTARQPIRLGLSGTYYHERGASLFDTAEGQVTISYTDPRFPYITPAFSYAYASGINYDGRLALVPLYDQNGNLQFDKNGYTLTTLRPGRATYLDGNYLEFRLTGNFFFLSRKQIAVNPYVLLSAGSGIIPRAFDTFSSTFFNQYTLNDTATNPTTVTRGAASKSFLAIGNEDPQVLDRHFDISNFQAGFRVSLYLTRYVTVTGDANYSRPLGNLRGGAYDQKDTIWGGVSLNFFF